LEDYSMYRTLAICCMGLALAACGQPDNEPEGTADTRARPDNPMPEPADDMAAPGQAPESAAAQVAPTQGNTASGSIAITAEENGVRLTGAIQGLKPNGEFGFHVHEKGDCSAPDASSAGAHFNPTNSAHGNPEGDTHHAGDMLNIKSDAQGVAQVDTVVTGLTLHSGAPTDALGKAVVVHESPDDYKTQPSGNSGARIACGVITVQAPTAG
jgi:Cu-Zn family superoxide dismutase